MAEIRVEPPKWDLRAAHWVSNVLNPPLMSVLGLVLMASFLGTRDAWLWAGMFIVLVVVVPTAYVGMLLRRGKIETFHIPRREDRKRPYQVIILCNMLGVALMVLFHAPFLLVAFGVMGVMQSTLLYVINSRWKISGHTTAISGLSVFMVAAMGWSLAPVLVTVPLVAWARVRTRSHSLWQAVAGILTGTSFILVTWYFLMTVLRPEF
jgi:hypothetical protein